MGGEVRAQQLLSDLARAARAAGLPARAAANIRITARIIGRTKAFGAVGRDLHTALLGLYSTALGVVAVNTRLLEPLWLQAALSALAVATVLMTKARWSVFGTGLRRLGGTWSVPARAVLAAAALGPRTASPNRRRRAATRKVSSHLRDLERRVVEVTPGMVKTEEFSLNRYRGDTTQAAAVYQGIAEPLTAEEIADTIDWVASRPSHVNVDLLVVRPRAQATQHKVHRLHE
ncbi:hypothetical protein [Streptomyces sp. LS1784]|uniref:hypothetical protein n=1 Tax=Streptomyces sp. LS1784 TaxID=2851533 RepID=UPI001CCEE02E|nr:hypothetical protein [Streptomyces sp. LS1784]